MKRAVWLGFGAVLLLAVGLRFWGITHDVWIDENKLVHPSIAMATAQEGIFSVSPKSYYPHLTHYVLAFVFKPIAVFNSDFSSAQYHVVARGILALVNVATVVVTFFIGRRLIGASGGLVAALFVAVMPLQVKYSHFAQVDLVAAFFMTLALWAALRIWDTGEKRFYVATGILVGAAGASQFWGFAAGAALLLSHAKWVTLSQFSRSRFFAPEFLAALIVIPFVFFACSPFLLIDKEQSLRTWHLLQGRGSAGDLGYTRAGILWPAYTSTPDWGLSFTRAGVMWETPWPVFALAIVGFGMSIWRRDWRFFVMTGVFALLVFLIINGTLKLYAVKRLMPLGPLLALLASYAVMYFPVSRIWRVGVAAVAIMFGVGMVIGFDAAYTHLATHAQAVRWAQDNIPAGAHVLQPAALMLLPWEDEKRVLVRMEHVYANFTPDDPEAAHDRAKSLDYWISEKRIDFIDIDSRLADRYYDPTSMTLYPETTASYRAFYDDVRRRGKLVFEIGPEFGKQAGARVEIYDVRQVR